MKFILKTEKNEKGNKVLSKIVKNGEISYIAKNEKGQVGHVNRQWVYENKDNILNATVSVDGKIIYSENKGSNKELEKQLKIIKSVYEKIFSEFSLTYYKGQRVLELVGYTGDSGEMVHTIEIANLYDFNDLFQKLYEMTDNFDPDEEAKNSMPNVYMRKHCHDIDEDDMEEDDDYRALKWRYEYIAEYKEDMLKSLTFSWKAKLEKKGYDPKYAEKLNEVYGLKGLETTISMED